MIQEPTNKLVLQSDKRKVEGAYGQMEEECREERRAMAALQKELEAASAERADGLQREADVCGELAAVRKELEAVRGEREQWQTERARGQLALEVALARAGEAGARAAAEKAAAVAVADDVMRGMRWMEEVVKASVAELVAAREEFVGMVADNDGLRERVKGLELELGKVAGERAAADGAGEALRAEMAT